MSSVSSHELCVGLGSVRRADRIDAIGLTVGLQDGSARCHAPSVVTRLPASLTSHQPPVHTSTATASRPAELQRGGVVQGCEGGWVRVRG